MKKNIIKKSLPILALLVTTLLGPIAAHAQSGSRLCGWTSKVEKDGKALQVLGMLYEARQKDASYDKQCDEAIDEMKKGIDKDPKLSTLSWQKVHKDTCESVGKDFASKTNSNTDMCDYMEAKKPYNVIKDNTKDTTSYTKL